MKKTLALIVLSLAAAAAACTPSDENPVGPTTTGTAALLGTWTSASLPTPTACSDFRWTVTQQSGNSASGTFTATCPGDIRVSGTATGSLNGTIVTWTAQGTASVPGFPSCAIALSGTAELGADSIRVPYSGDTCLGRVSGVEILRKS